MWILHPLYKTETVAWFPEDINALKKGKIEKYHIGPKGTENAPGQYRKLHGEYKDNKIIFDIKLTSLGGNLNSESGYWRYFAFARIKGIDITTVIPKDTFEMLLEKDRSIKHIYSTDIEEIVKWESLY